MNLPEPPEREEVENVLPLINVVFLLLIFFMISGVLVRPELFEIDPLTSAAKAAEAKGEATILLSADGRIALNDSVIGKQQLQAWFAEQGGLAGQSDAQPRISLKADAAVDTSKVIDIMQWAKEAGIGELTLFTVSK